MSADATGWVRVGTRAELLPGEYRVVWDGDTSIAPELESPHEHHRSLPRDRA